MENKKECGSSSLLAANKFTVKHTSNLASVAHLLELPAFPTCKCSGNAGFKAFRRNYLHILQLNPLKR
ncbi:hypothetical protein [Paenibacillus sp. yr247]|uniref:hypothetical protein n=1 Tax=Paenibacillus sp. yr247 TaxID=1761880 RepID=UPI00114023DF|nr:hypothetical protein [Paenibacillus sp. yr247]